MKKLEHTSKELLSRVAPLGLILLLALALRLAGIGYGLPGTFWPDEPHHINVALNFGSGDLNPHVFKYPTFWMYTLFFSFGLAFLFWSGFGLLKTSAQFAHLFVWDPTLIYMTARVTTVLLGVVAIYFVYQSAKMLFSKESALVAALLLAVSPPLVVFSHQAKADMLLLLLCAASIYFSLKFYQQGRLRNALVAGFLMGLVLATQYTGLFLLPFLGWCILMRGFNDGWANSQKTVLTALFAGYFLVVAGLFIGSPYIFLDFHTFLLYFGDNLRYGQGNMSASSAKVGFSIFGRFFNLAGPVIVGALIFFASLVTLFRANKKLTLLLLIPLAWTAVGLGLQSKQADVVNYSFPVYPVLAIILSGFTLSPAYLRLKTGGRCLFVAVLVLPALFNTLQFDQRYLYNDARTQAKAWIETNIPEGSKILMGPVHQMPPLIMSKEQVERLVEKTTREGHPRQRYYQNMLDSHPGGGYDIMRILFTTDEVVSGKTITEWSQKGYELLDVEAGIQAARDAGIEYVVMTNWLRTPRLKKFFDELEAQDPVVQFKIDKVSFSPIITIYRIKK